MIADLTVLIPNHNGILYLNDAILSIRRSSTLPKVVKIIDNGSTDKSLEYIKSLDSEEFIIEVDHINIPGTGRALNKGLQNVNTKYIMRMDVDDIICYDKIERQLKAFNDDEELFIVGTNAHYFIQNIDNIIESSGLPTKHENIMKSYSHGFHGMFDATIMFKNSSIIRDCMYNEDIQIGNEFSFHLDIIKKHNLKAINLIDKLYYIRLHQLSTTSNSSIVDYRKIFSIKKHYFSSKNSIFENLSIHRLNIHHQLWKKALLMKRNHKLRYYLIIFYLIILFPNRAFRRLTRLF